MATLEDIARTLGVSKGTVSKALSGAGGVSDAMRQSVVETAVELGYSRICRKDASRCIAVFITNMDYAKPEDFGYDILAGFRKLAEPDGYQVVVVPLSCALENSVPYDAYMMQHNYLGGLFLGLSFNDPWLEGFKTCKTPAVLYDNCVPGNPRVTSISVDNAEAMNQAVRYLKSLGHKKIGYLSYALESYVYQQRYQAFFRAAQVNGLPCSESLGKCDFFTSVCLSEHLPALLEQGCTAIVCSHDRLANSVLIDCQERGIRVPEDLNPGLRRPAAVPVHAAAPDHHPPEPCRAGQERLFCAVQPAARCFHQPDPAAHRADRALLLRQGPAAAAGQKTHSPGRARHQKGTK